MLLLLPRADLSGEVVHGDHGVHVATEIVEILLVEGEDNVSEVVNVAPASLSPHTTNHLVHQSEVNTNQPIRGQCHLEEQLLAVCVDKGHQGLHLPGHGDQVTQEAGGALHWMLLRHGQARDGRL